MPSDTRVSVRMGSSLRDKLKGMAEDLNVSVPFLCMVAIREGMYLAASKIQRLPKEDLE